MTRILAVLTDPDTVCACLDAAGTAASVAPNVELEAFHPRLRPESLILPTEEVMTEKRRAAIVAMQDGKSGAIRRQVDAWVSGSNRKAVPIWIEIEGPTIGTVLAEVAQKADLLVIARPSDIEGREALHSAMFETGSLLLLVPPRRDVGLLRFGQHILIAWKPSDQARAAVRASIPWLKHAARVTVLIVGQQRPPVEDGEEDFSLLHSHGINAEVVAVSTEDNSVGERILHEAHAREADCLIMGAYRHSRIAEMILGGVTRHMLQDADMPIFMRH
jgi:nucleotide-binding universal stress UspA family protein